MERKQVVLLNILSCSQPQQLDSRTIQLVVEYEYPEYEHMCDDAIYKVRSGGFWLDNVIHVEKNGEERVVKCVYVFHKQLWERGIDKAMQRANALKTDLEQYIQSRPYTKA